VPAYADLVHQTSTGTGTGNLALTAVNGKRSFLSAFGTGGTNTFYYFISSRAAAEWERGSGHESGGALVRDTVLASSNANALVNFAAGFKDITSNQPANIRVNTNTANTLAGDLTLTSGGSFFSPYLTSPSANLILSAPSGGIFLRPNGPANATNQLLLNGPDGNVTITGSLSSGGVNSDYITSSVSNPNVIVAGRGGAVFFRPNGTGSTSGQALIDNTGASSFLSHMGVTGNISTTTKGYQPGGGLWGDSSDARIKNVIGDYTRGLDDVTALRPVYYTYKGNDTLAPPSNSIHPQMQAEAKADEEPPLTPPYLNSPHYKAAVDQKRFAGLIAQEVEAIFPEMVTPRDAYIDGTAVADLRELDTTPLLFALINAIKELKARVATLEGTR
jgi:hypothetical protein